MLEVVHQHIASHGGCVGQLWECILRNRVERVVARQAALHQPIQSLQHILLATLVESAG